MEEMIFEQSMKRLEQIVSKLEAGDTPLDTSMKLFEEGTALSAKLAKMLDEAQQKITIIQKHDGVQQETEFNIDENGEPQA